MWERKFDLPAGEPRGQGEGLGGKGDGIGEGEVEWLPGEGKNEEDNVEVLKRTE